MIYLYYGKIGDGKTYHVVRNEVLPAVRSGRRVYTNIDGLSARRLQQVGGAGVVKLDQWHTVDQVRAAVQVAENDKDGVSLQVEQGSLIVVDEAQLVWDARGFKDMSKGTLSFLEQHRHWGLDVVLVTQSPGRLDKAILRLCNECYHVKNLRFLSGLMDGRYVVNVRQSPFDREAMATYRGKYDSEIFSLYRSAVTGSRFRVKKTAMGTGLMLWAPLLVVLSAVLWIRSGGLSILHPGTQPAKIDSGVVRPPEAWSKPGPELRRIDPPIVVDRGVGPVDSARSVEGGSGSLVHDEKGKSGVEKRQVGMVEVDGVVTTIWHEGDRMLRTGS